MAQREHQPPSARIATHIGERIRSGQIKPGEQLPSMAELASEHGVSMPTVAKALRILKQEGLVTSVPGWGTFAAEQL